MNACWLPLVGKGCDLDGYIDWLAGVLFCCCCKLTWFCKLVFSCKMQMQSSWSAKNNNAANRVVFLFCNCKTDTKLAEPCTASSISADWLC